MNSSDTFKSISMRYARVADTFKPNTIERTFPYSLLDLVVNEPPASKAFTVWTEDTRKYKHYCEECVYLGYADVNGEYMEFYVCERDNKTPKQRAYVSLLGRYGNDGGDYLSTQPYVASPISVFGSLALSLYLKHLGCNGTNAFPVGTFYKDNETILILGGR